MNNVDKFGFPFCWFVDAYDEINGIGASNKLSNDTKTKIDKIYTLNCLNYSKFIELISVLLNISQKDKIEFMKKEQKCVMCKHNYPYSYEIFTNFIDFYTSQKLNLNICFNCAHAKYSCSNCNLNCGSDPYENIYICTDKDIKNKFLTFCKLCYKNRSEIPIVCLFYKDTKINIEFNKF